MSIGGDRIARCEQYRARQQHKIVRARGVHCDVYSAVRWVGARVTELSSKLMSC